MRLQKRGCASFLREMQPATRIICPPVGGAKFHTRGLRSVFPEAHVPGKNRFDLIRVCGHELCEAFLTSCADREGAGL